MKCFEKILILKFVNWNAFLRSYVCKYLPYVSCNCNPYICILLGDYPLILYTSFLDLHELIQWWRN